jgi:hypothetical protein
MKEIISVTWMWEWTVLSPYLFVSNKHPSFIWCRYLDASGSRSETPGKFLNVMLEKNGELSWTDHLNSEVLLRAKEQRNILHEISKRKANWIGHILRRNCLLQQVIEGKVKGGIEVRVRRRRRRRQLLFDIKERRGYSIWRRNLYFALCGDLALEEALDLS